MFIHVLFHDIWFDYLTAVQQFRKSEFAVTMQYYHIIYRLFIVLFSHFAVFLFFFLPVLSNSNVQDSVKKGSAFQKVSRISDGTGELQLSSIFGSG